MKECAFCPSPAVAHGGEHAWSDWINRILPDKRFRLLSFSDTGPHHTYIKRKLDVKFPVVCEACNNEWMSGLENDHAKPAIKDLILSDKFVKLSPQRLDSIAKFAFKTAVVADHFSLASDMPFFSTAARYTFRESLTIPGGVQMWIAAFKERGHGALRAVYHESPAKMANGFQLYALTFGAGYFLVQVVSCRWRAPGGISGFVPFVTQAKFWDKFSAPFWPPRNEAILWPSDKQFNVLWCNKFSSRWQETSVPESWLRID